MAFATRSLRILCKAYSGSCNASYSTLRKPIRKINFISATQKYSYSTAENPPKITGTLTNIQSSISPKSLLAEHLPGKTEQSQEDLIKEEQEEQKQREQSWRMMRWSFIAFGVSSALAGSMIIYELSKPTYDDDGNLIEDEFSPLPFPQRIWMRLCTALTYYKKLVQEPSREKLLPDPMKYPYIQPPYTLVLEMTDVLIHPDWTYQTGWRFKKRPGVDQFLEALAPPQFEIVVYTAEQGLTVDPILNSLDPQNCIMFRLYRDATRFMDGHHVKDLEALNRDLSKVIVIDWDSNSVKLHQENTLKLPRWTGNDDDTTLFDLAAFLKTILATNVEDVREVLNYYRQFDNPLEVFRENQLKLLQQMQEDEEMKKQSQGTKALTSKWSPSFLRSH